MEAIVGQDQKIVVVGGGQAAAELSFTARQLGHKGPIVILTSEALPPYQRPPLSKAYLKGDINEGALYLRPQAIYQKFGIEVRTEALVSRIDRAARCVHIGNEIISYDGLALATGGEARRLKIPGSAARNVLYLRTHEDAVQLRAILTPGCRVAVIGGGYIGLEVAAVAAREGAKVTVIEAEPRLLARVAHPLLSEFYQKLHESEGVAFLMGAVTERFEIVGDKAVAAFTSNGKAVEFDFAVVGIGLIANTALAQDAGIEVENGILVDEYARTSDHGIVAAGDCTRHRDFQATGPRRIESVPNAIEQGRTAARSLVGQHQPHSATPWFWSDQYGAKLQSVGISEPGDRIILRGDMDNQAFSFLQLRGGCIAAADVVNRPHEFAIIRELVGRRASVDFRQLEDDGFDLRALL